MSEIVNWAPNMGPNAGANNGGSIASVPCPNPFGPGKVVSRPSRPEAPQNTNNPFSAAYVAALPPQPEPRYISQAEYEGNEIVATIRELVSNNRYDAWSGTANELLAAAQAKMRLADATVQQIDRQIEDLEDYLRVYDDIYHFYYRSGNIMLHGFCEAIPDEDGVC